MVLNLYDNISKTQKWQHQITLVVGQKDKQEVEL